jgi:hypothetical protein
MINLENAKLIGESKWVKDMAYQVYELNNKYYAAIVVGHSNKEVLSIVEISKEKINLYI